MTVVAVIGLGYVGCRWSSSSASTRARSASTSSVEGRACRRGVDPSRELADAEMPPPRTPSTPPIRRCSARPTSSSSRCRRRSTRRTSPTSARSIGASASVGRHMKQGATVVYESTVYPGATEEVCIPVLERESGMKWKQDFFVGYSPGAHQPGRPRAHADEDRQGGRRATRRETLERVAALYEKIVEPGVHRARRIKAAEAAKVIENTQRDLNIALMNELAIIFDRIGIDTSEVLEAAGTKWNFLQFRPGLVGGHCIGVDPYYLTHKARDARLPPAGDPRRPAHQRRHGQVHRRADDQADDRRRQLRQGRARQRARPDLQGELRRPAQPQGRSTSSTS